MINRTTQVVIDLVALSSAFWLAFLLRFDWALPYAMLKRALFLWPYVVGFKYLLLVLFGVPRFVWRYIGLREAQRIIAVLAAASAVLVGARVVSGALLQTRAFVQYGLIPFGVIAVDFVLALFAILGVRVLRRLWTERSAAASHKRRRKPAVRTLLIGAGQAGVMVAKEVAARPDLGIAPIGFLDDDPAKVGTIIQGVKVLGTTARFTEICQKHRPSQALITVANAPGRDIRRINALCRHANLPAKIIPGLYEIMDGRINLSRIRPVAIEDLLGREPVVLEQDSISRMVRGRVVLVTGAGGSIGSELCRQLCRYEPERLVLVEQAENALFSIHKEFDEISGSLEVIPRVVDVCDEPSLRRVFEAHRPDVVFHAAAHKHVPMMEWNVCEAIKNNVLGTQIVTDLAHEYQARSLVMISTDKAVNPTSVMGATKRAAEVYVQAISAGSKTQCVTVRFGNVLGSAGSVIPIFQQQIARGGPITVTHPEMQRYFMTIPEACQLVLQAGTMGQGGEIFILDMGEPVKILDLARDLIRLSGVDDLPIEYTGIRPGEKLFEELSVQAECADKTKHPKIFVGRTQPQPLSLVREALDRLIHAIETGDDEVARATLGEIVVESHLGGSTPSERREARTKPFSEGTRPADRSVETDDPSATGTPIGLHARYRRA